MSRIDDIEMRVGYSVAYRLVPAVRESDLDWLIAEHRRMEAEIARYRDALAGLYIAPNYEGDPTIWLPAGKVARFAVLCKSDVADRCDGLLWDALVKILPERDR